MEDKKDQSEISGLIPDEKDLEIFMAPRQPKQPKQKHVIDITPIVVDERSANQKIESDYKNAQDSLKEILSVTKSSIDELVDLASSSGHPRVYEVLNGFLKTMESTSKSLIELHKQKQELDQNSELDKGEKASNQTINNLAVFVGSTKELSDIMKNVIKKQE